MFGKHEPHQKYWMSGGLQSLTNAIPKPWISEMEAFGCTTCLDLKVMFTGVERTLVGSKKKRFLKRTDF